MPVATGFIRDFSDTVTKKLLADNIKREISKATGISAGDQDDSILERFREKFFPNRAPVEEDPKMLIWILELLWSTNLHVSCP